VKWLLAALRKCREQRNSWALARGFATKEYLIENQKDRADEDAALLAILEGGEK
jgi:hypothetical protein